MGEFPISRDGILFDNPPYVRGAFPEDIQWPRQIRVCSPCVGLDAPRRAGLELGVPWLSTDVSDLRRDLRVPLSRLPGHHGKLHLGPAAGDVTARELSSLKDADGLISGPPCPPYSTIGARGFCTDARSNVLEVVGGWAAALAHRGCLAFFILENVEGLFKRSLDQEVSYGIQFMESLAKALPPGWQLKVSHVNSRDCGVPQSRPRVFMIGVCPAMLRSPLQKRLWSLPPRVCPTMPLHALLDPVARPEDYDSLTINQKLNVDARMDEWESIRGNRSPPSELGIIDVGRDSAKPYDGAFGFDESHTLRLNNSNLWVCPASHLHGMYGKKGRLLSWQEKARLSGVVPESIEGLSRAGVEKALGNTIPVPLIGTVMAPVLLAWREMHRVELLRPVASANADSEEEGCEFVS